jgi:hypothetical protein
MKSRIRWAIVVFAALTAGRASAVPPQPDYGNNTANIRSQGARYQPQRPTISPYLAMTQNTNIATLNYFTITQPLFVARAASRQQGQELEQLERQVRAEAQLLDPVTGQPRIRSTGSRAGFMTQRSYFNIKNANSSR